MALVHEITFCITKDKTRPSLSLSVFLSDLTAVLAAMWDVYFVSLKGIFPYSYFTLFTKIASILFSDMKAQVEFRVKDVTVHAFFHNNVTMLFLKIAQTFF